MPQLNIEVVEAQEAGGIADRPLSAIGEM